MALKFYNENDIVRTETILATIFGDPGLGKTSLAFTADDPLLLDFDLGVQRAINTKRYVRIDSWNDVQDLQRDPVFVTNKPKTLILDTGGTMIDNFIADYAKAQDPLNSRRGGELSLQGYGSIKNIFKQFKDWTRTLGINVVIICHATSDPKRDGKIIPHVTGGSLDLLRRESDLIGFVYSDKNKRVIDFRPIDTHDGKDCANIGLVEIPDFKDPKFNNFLQSIFDKTLQKMNEMSEEQKKVLENIKNYRDQVAKVKTVKASNDIVKKLMSESKSIQLQIFSELKKYTIENNIASYDKEQRKFVKHVESKP